MYHRKLILGVLFSTFFLGLSGCATVSINSGKSSRTLSILVRAVTEPALQDEKLASLGWAS